MELSTLLDNIDMKQSAVFILNSDKSDKIWVPYLPFVNSIRNADALFDFIIGDMTLIVVIDTAYLCGCLTMPGWKISMVEHPTMTILFTHESGATFASSSQFFARFGLELMSLKWFVEYQKASITDALAGFNEQTGAVIDMRALEALEDMLRKAPPLFG
jgi:hypothetical protein